MLRLFIIGLALSTTTPVWRDRINHIIRDNPTWSETQVGWKIYEELAVNGARLMLPVHERESHRLGRLSIQTDPALYRNGPAILEQATYFASLALSFGEGPAEDVLRIWADGKLIYDKT